MSHPTVGDSLSGELFELAVAMGSTFEALGIPYVIGGSMASSLVGEPRATADLDVAVRMVTARGRNPRTGSRFDRYSNRIGSQNA